MSGYYPDTWASEDWTYGEPDQWGTGDVYAESATQYDEQAYSSMVAQRPLDAGRDYQKSSIAAPPSWNGDPLMLDLWTNKLSDWEASTRTPPDKQAYAVLATLPAKPQARLRQDLVKPRMSATSWREEVTK